MTDVPPPAQPAPGSGNKVWFGLIAVLVGLGAVILADQTKLTITKAFVGGVYIKDAYRLGLQYCGYGLIVLGVLLVLLSSLANSDPSAIRTLTSITGLLGVLTLLGGLLIYTAYRRQQNQQQQSQSVTSTDTTTTTTETQSTTSPGDAFTITCNLDGSGHATATCTNADGSPAPPPGQDPETTNCQDSGPNAERSVEIYQCVLPSITATGG